MLRILLTVLTILMAGPVAAEKRMALVLGNGDYAHAPALDNAVRDALAIGAALERLNFEVIAVTNADSEATRTAIRDFAVALEGADLALFFYAGHGIQLDGINYIVPTDARVDREADVELATFPLDIILAQMDRGAATRIVLLDACRNNPFETRLTRTMGQARSASLGRGLAPIEARGGTFVGYATDPGEVAFDGVGRHSPFTEALLKYIDTPGLEINAMMTRVRAEVFNATGAMQRPWSSSSLLREVYFRQDTPDQDADRRLADVAAWQDVADSTDAADFEAYLNAFPDGLFRDLAAVRLADALAAQDAAPDLQASLRPVARPLVLPTPDAAPEPESEPEPLVDTVPPKVSAAPCALCPKVVAIPGGPTILGDASGTAAEKPEVRQTIAPFQMTEAEISVGDIRRFVEMSGAAIPRGCWAWTADGRLRRTKTAYWGAPGYDVDDSSPAACLNWNDAQTYIDWLSEIDADATWRLPTEAEFEYAARAGSASAYPWPGGADAVCRYANGADADSRFRWRNPACSDGATETASAGAFTPNAFGLSHMIGNLWEWTADCWNGTNAGASETGAAREQGVCASRVLRGGSWDDPVENLRASYRVGIPRDRRQANVGFRAVRVPNENASQ